MIINLNRIGVELALFILLLILSVASLAFRAGSSAATKEIPVHGIVRPASYGDELVRTQDPRKVEVELITLQSTGFEPAEVTRPSGPFLMSIINRSGLPQLSLVLQRDDRGFSERKRIGKERVWRRVFDLQPGRYVLRDIDHPEWKCQITITNSRASAL
jgi:hypothetical protein